MASRSTPPSGNSRSALCSSADPSRVSPSVRGRLGNIWPQPECEQDPFPVTEVTDDLRYGLRRQFGEAGCDEHTFGHRAARVLEDVDHFQLVAALKVLRANRLEI